MATYKSECVLLSYPAEKVYAKLSNLESLKSVLANIPADKIPADQLKQLEQIEVTPDSIAFPAGPVGMLTLRVAQREEPTLIKLIGEGSPVPLSLSMAIEPIDQASCRATVIIDIEIPPMLKPMVNGPLSKMTEQFAQMIKIIPFD